MAVNPERYLNKSVTEIKADAGAAKATNASGKKLMTNLKKKVNSTKPESKTEEVSKRRKSTSGSTSDKKKNRRKKKKTNGSTESSNDSSSQE